MRGARRLYLLHLGLAGLGTLLLAGTAGVLVERQSFAVPSSREISAACDDWLAAGGPASLLGLAIAVLAMSAVGLGLHSVWRQLAATRRYLAAQRPLGKSVEVDGVRCLLLDVEEPRAFCAGYLRPRIYLSRGAREQLDPAELRAVLAHEAHHRAHRDPLRLLAARALADALFFIPILRRSSERYAALGELAADEAAVRALGSRGPLAAALLRFSEPAGQPTAAVASLAPERVDHLMGDPEVTRWRLPRPPLARSALALAALGAAGFLIWHGFLDPNLQAPLLLTAACTGLMLCGPATLAAAALLISHQALRRRRPFADD